MSLPQRDHDSLSGLGVDFEVVIEGGVTCVVLKGWRLPPGYNHSTADLLIRLSAGYPDVRPDMWWFAPPISAANGSSLPNTEVMENHLGRQWQRWSRHLQPEQWKSGVDSLESYVALVRQHLERSVPSAVR